MNNGVGWNRKRSSLCSAVFSRRKMRKSQSSWLTLLKKRSQKVNRTSAPSALMFGPVLALTGTSSRLVLPLFPFFRVCSLKCGHLFGHSCVKTWLANSPRCPECNDHALLDDIRIIRAKTISAVDNSNETILRRELDEKTKKVEELEERDKRRRVQTNLQTSLLVFSLIFNVYMAAVYSTLVFGPTAFSRLEIDSIW